MTIRNPFRTSGKFLTVDMVAVLEPEVKRSRRYHEQLVSQRRMKPENFDAKIGGQEAILEMLKERLVREDRAQVSENEGDAFTIYLPDEDSAKEFLNWANERRFPVRLA